MYICYQSEKNTVKNYSFQYSIFMTNIKSHEQILHLTYNIPEKFS